MIIEDLFDSIFVEGIDLSVDVEDEDKGKKIILLIGSILRFIKSLINLSIAFIAPNWMILKRHDELS